MSIHESADADFRPEPRPVTGLATVSESPRTREPKPVPAADTAPLPDDLVTRLLSAQTYMRESFADRVNSELVHPSRAALPPLWHVDAVQLARHAVQARKLRRTRDVGLAATLGYVVLAGVLVLAVMLAGILGLIQALLIWIVLWLWATSSLSGWSTRRPWRLAGPRSR